MRLSTDAHIFSKVDSDTNGPVPRVLFAVTTRISQSLLGTLPASLAAEGFEVHEVANMGSDGKLETRNPGSTLHHVAFVREPSLLKDAIALLRTVQLLRAVKPRIVLGGTPKASFILMLASRIVGTPFRVYLLFGLRLETTRGTFAKILSMVEFVTASASTHVIAVSESLKVKFVDRGLSPKEKVTVLGFGSSKGVDLDQFHPRSRKTRDKDDALKQQLGIRPNVPTIGFFGRISSDKGFQVLNKARILLAERGIDHQILIAGHIETQVADPFADHPLLRPAIYVGHTLDLAPLYRVLDVFCLPTLREGLPNVCIEANSSGIPVITTTATGAIDSVEDGVNGLLIEPDSADALATALERVITDSKLRLSLARNARRWVAERFDGRQVEERYVNFIKGLLGAEPKYLGAEPK